MIGTCYPRHRNEEFLKFLRKIDRETPQGLPLHLILDNYGTHNHPNVKKWLDFLGRQTLDAQAMGGVHYRAVDQD